MINGDGKSVTDLQSIKSLAPAHYKQLFHQDSYWNVANWISRDVSFLEIKSALFQMHPDKAPGPDGYNAHFIAFSPITSCFLFFFSFFNKEKLINNRRERTVNASVAYCFYEFGPYSQYAMTEVSKKPKHT